MKDEQDLPRALQGIRVADFTWFISGPLVSKFLGDCGAEIIHIESATNPDNLRGTVPMKDDIPGINRSAVFARYNSSKYGVSINLKHPRGVELARRLVAWSDIVVENFTPGVMERLGLSYSNLRKSKEDIIMISLPMFGHTGPFAGHPGLGSQLADVAGFGNITGWPDRGPSSPPGAYTDFITPYYALAAVMGALDYRRRTGKGQYIEISQYEAGIHFLTPLILEWFVNSIEPRRAGNHCPGVVPYGVYRCRGVDRWCAISVFTDQEWQSLCRAMDQPGLADDPRFATLLSRLENRDDLDRAIEEWTTGRSAEDVMTTLQQAGIAAGSVSDGRALVEDPQLNARGFYAQLVHPEIGAHRYLRPPFKFSQSAASPTSPAPCLGQHNEYVFRHIIGLNDDEFVQLLNEGVLE